MVHKELYQQMADKAAAKLGGYALHIGKIGDDKFVYSVRPACSADFDPADQTLIVVSAPTSVHGQPLSGSPCPALTSPAAEARQDSTPEVRIFTGSEAQKILSETTLREFTTGRAIMKKYRTLVENHSAIIGEGLSYAESLVAALDSRAVTPALLYPYLELAARHHKHLALTPNTVTLI